MAKKRTFSVSLSPMPCSCGGTLRPFHRQGTYDAEVELGLPVLLTGSWVALRCDRCGELALPGKVLDVLTEGVVLQVLGLKRRLAGRESQFLRKAALGIGQQDLAMRLGVSRPTVARWEALRSLSAEHDFALRGLVVAHLLKLSRLAGPWKKRSGALVELITGTLEHARTAPAPATLPPLRVAA